MTREEVILELRGVDETLAGFDEDLRLDGMSTPDRAALATSMRRIGRCIDALEASR